MKSGKFIVFVMFAMFGVMIAMQFRTIMAAQASAKKDTVSEIQRLIGIIENEKKEIADLQQQINAEKQRENELEYSFIMRQKDSELERLFQQLQDARLKSGLLSVTGPGLIIKLDDAAARQDMEKGSLVIHDSDIKAILNELKTAGAQAISINGERLIATSEQICAGPTIRINWRKYAVPYVIHAIGDPDRLNKALKSSRRIAYMIRDGIKVDIRATRNVTVPGFNTGGRSLDEYINMLEVVNHEVG